jgi:hypothetical protein
MFVTNFFSVSEEEKATVVPDDPGVLVKRGQPCPLPAAV